MLCLAIRHHNVSADPDISEEMEGPNLFAFQRNLIAVLSKMVEREVFNYDFSNGVSSSGGDEIPLLYKGFSVIGFTGTRAL